MPPNLELTAIEALDMENSSSIYHWRNTECIKSVMEIHCTTWTWIYAKCLRNLHKHALSSITTDHLFRLPTLERLDYSATKRMQFCTVPTLQCGFFFGDQNMYFKCCYFLMNNSIIIWVIKSSAFIQHPMWKVKLISLRLPLWFRQLV